MKFITTILLSCLFLCGCQNTVKGFGQDMSNTGQEIKKAAN